MKVEIGSAIEQSALNPDGTPNGWFVGSRRFIHENSLRQCENMEIKWSLHPNGFYSGIKPCAVGLGISVLIDGIFVLGIREAADQPWQEFRLDKRGDFILSLGGNAHYYRAEDD